MGVEILPSKKMNGFQLVSTVEGPWPPTLSPRELKGRLHFWSLFQNLAYYSLMIPFHPVQYHTVQNPYGWGSSKYQKIGMILLQSVLVPYIVIPELGNLTSDKLGGVTSILKTSLNLALVVVLSWNCWGREEAYFKLHQSLNDPLHGFGGVNKTSRKVTWIVVLGGGMTLLYLIIQVLRILQFYDWDVISIVVDSFCGETSTPSRQCPFLNRTNGSPDLLQGYNPLLRYLLILIFFLPLNIYSWYCYVFIDLSFLLSAALLWDLVSKFLTRFDQNASKPDEILSHFQWLQDGVELLNGATSAISFQSTMGSVAIISSSLSTLFIKQGTTPPSKSQYLAVCLHLLGKFGAILIAACAHNKVQDLEKWIHGNKWYFKSHPVELQLALFDLNRGRVALQPFGLYKIDFAFLGTFLGIVASYAVVMSQIS